MIDGGYGFRNMQEAGIPGTWKKWIDCSSRPEEMTEPYL